MVWDTPSHQLLCWFPVQLSPFIYLCSPKTWSVSSASVIMELCSGPFEDGNVILLLHQEDQALCIIANQKQAAKDYACHQSPPLLLVQWLLLHSAQPLPDQQLSSPPAQPHAAVAKWMSILQIPSNLKGGQLAPSQQPPAQLAQPHCLPPVQQLSLHPAQPLAALANLRSILQIPSVPTCQGGQLASVTTALTGSGITTYGEMTFIAPCTATCSSGQFDEHLIDPQCPNLLRGPTCFHCISLQWSWHTHTIHFWCNDFCHTLHSHMWYWSI
jgi:hypothetical protein